MPGPTFDWNKNFTSSDMVNFVSPGVMCPFRFAMAERIRAVTESLDFYNKYPLNDFILHYELIQGTEFVDLNVQPLNVRVAQRQMEEDRNLAAYKDGPFGPITPYTFLGGPGELFNVQNFNWIGIQQIIYDIGLIYIDPTVDVDGYGKTQKESVVNAYADAYYPTYPSMAFGGMTANASFKKDNSWDAPQFSGSGSAPHVAPIAWKAPNWPGPHGFTRKRHREITSLSCTGTNGQRAYFRVADPDSVSISGYTGVQKPGILQDYATPSAYPSQPWIIDPKPLIRDVQVPSLPVTPDDQRKYSGKIMKRVGGTWVVDTDQKTYPDIVTLYGFMHAGDIVGPWILNEIRDAINSLFVCQYPAVAFKYADEGGQIVGVGSIYGGYYSIKPPFAKRIFRLYRVQVTVNDDNTETFGSYEFLAESPATQQCDYFFDELGPIEDGYVYLATVDFSPGFLYRSDTNPSTCPHSWPPASCTGTKCAYTAFVRVNCATGETLGDPVIGIKYCNETDIPTPFKWELAFPKTSDITTLKMEIQGGAPCPEDGSDGCPEITPPAAPTPEEISNLCGGTDCLKCDKNCQYKPDSLASVSTGFYYNQYGDRFDLPAVYGLTKDTENLCSWTKESSGTIHFTQANGNESDFNFSSVRVEVYQVNTTANTAGSVGVLVEYFQVTYFDSGGGIVARISVIPKSCTDGNTATGGSIYPTIYGTVPVTITGNGGCEGVQCLGCDIGGTVWSDENDNRLYIDSFDSDSAGWPFYFGEQSGTITCDQSSGLIFEFSDGTTQAGSISNCNSIEAGGSHFTRVE